VYHFFTDISGKFVVQSDVNGKESKTRRHVLLTLTDGREKEREREHFCCRLLIPDRSLKHTCVIWIETKSYM